MFLRFYTFFLFRTIRTRYTIRSCCVFLNFSFVFFKLWFSLYIYITNYYRKHDDTSNWNCSGDIVFLLLHYTIIPLLPLASCIFIIHKKIMPLDRGEHFSFHGGIARIAAFLKKHISAMPIKYYGRRCKFLGFGLLSSVLNINYKL